MEEMNPKRIHAINVQPVLTIKMVEDALKKDNLFLQVAVDDCGVCLYRVVDQNDILQTYEQGLSLIEVAAYAGINIEGGKALMKKTDTPVKKSSIYINDEEPQLEQYGKYYIRFKRDGGTPSKITVLKIHKDNKKVTVVRGHHDKNDIQHSTMLDKIVCDKNRIFTHVNKKQMRKFKNQDLEMEKKREIAYKIIYEFGIKIPCLSWGCSTISELEKYYNELKMKASE